MRILIGEEGMKKAASVKKDAKAAKAAGMESPQEQRKDRERREAEKERRRRKRKRPLLKAQEEGRRRLGRFDLDCSIHLHEWPGRSAPTGRRVRWWQPRLLKKWTE